MGTERLTEEQVEQIAEAVRAHQCRFDDMEAKDFHALAGILANGGLDNIRYLVTMGASMRTFSKAATVAAAGILVAGVAKILWEGIKMLIHGGGPR
jgi:hypothetical protein